MSLVSYRDSEKVATERYNEEEMLENLIGSKDLPEGFGKFPISQSMDNIIETPQLDV